MDNEWLVVESYASEKYQQVGTKWKFQTVSGKKHVPNHQPNNKCGLKKKKHISLNHLVPMEPHVGGTPAAQDPSTRCSFHRQHRRSRSQTRTNNSSPGWNWKTLQLWVCRNVINHPFWRLRNHPSKWWWMGDGLWHCYTNISFEGTTS